MMLATARLRRGANRRARATLAPHSTDRDLSSRSSAAGGDELRQAANLRAVPGPCNMPSPAELTRRRKLQVAHTALHHGFRRVVQKMPPATTERLSVETLRALRTSLPIAHELIGLALSGYYVSVNQGSAALNAASTAINALAQDVTSDPESSALPDTWRDDVFLLQGYVADAVNSAS